MGTYVLCIESFANAFSNWPGVFFVFSSIRRRNRSYDRAAKNDGNFDNYSQRGTLFFQRAYHHVAPCRACTRMHVTINAIRSPTERVRIHGFITDNAVCKFPSLPRHRDTLEQPAEWNRLSAVHARYAHYSAKWNLSSCSREKGAGRVHYADEARPLIFRALGILSTTVVNRFPVRPASAFPLYIFLLLIHSANFLFFFFFFDERFAARSRKSTRFMSPSSDPSPSSSPSPLVMN